jgi:O-succinylbenzoate synthase
MIITKIEILTISIPLKKYFETSFGRIENRDTIIIKMYADNGCVGYGESSLLRLPLSENETIDFGIKLLKSKICPRIIGNSFNDILKLKNILDNFPNNPVTKIGIEGAFYDLLSQKEEKYLGKLFGAQKQHITAGESIGIYNNRNNTLKEVEKFIKKGYKTLKLKIKPGYDYNIIKKIKEKYSHLNLGVDANAAYTIDDMHALLRLEKFNLLFIEQPFRATELLNHSELQKKIKIPICLDESIKSLNNAKQAVKQKSCKIINIKPARIGSYYESKQIHDLCYKNNIGIFGGGRLETGIGKAFNLALAGLPGYNYPLDISSSLEYFIDDLIRPAFNTDGGGIDIPSQIGLGFKIDENKLKNYTINKLTIKK